MSRIKREEPARTTRVPVSSSRSPLEVKGFDQKNYQGRWVMDVDDRIQVFLEGGYEFVPKSEIQGRAGEKTADTSSGLDSRISKPAGRGKTLYLMRLPRKFYEEDRKAKDVEIDRTEEGLKNPLKGEGNYGKIKIGNEAAQS